jgi:phytanoyl-CoA hydroxylase
MTSEAMVERFVTDGYVVAEDVLDPMNDIGPVWAEYEEVLENLAQSLYEEGEVQSTYGDLSFTDRLIALHRDCGKELSRYFDISLPEIDLETCTPLHVGPSVFRLLTNPRLLDCVEAILGSEIYAHPVQKVRLKLPASVIDEHRDFSLLVAPTPWHQDNGSVMPDADETPMLTVWVPLNEATVQNGCLEVLPRTHLSDILLHCVSETLGASIPESLIPDEEAVPIPMKPGSVLLLHRRNIHRSLPNATESEVRISWDLRYTPAGMPTGRSQYPGFIARSRKDPDSVLRDPVQWANMWYETRARLANRVHASDFFRWGDHPLC